ncbi:MAG: hypothetical protein GKS06_16505 [Acidobacteria bacterium]|nr:hypothetical protein [Acidobacteriota bacterium]
MIERLGFRLVRAAAGFVLVVAFGITPAVGAQQQVVSQHAIVDYSAQLGIATTVANTVDQIWGPMVAFFTPLGLTDLSPIQIQLVASVPGQAPGYTPIAAPHQIQMSLANPVTISGQPSYQTTVAHEMFHVLAYRAGVVTSAKAQNQKNYWIIEGVAELAEHMFLPQRPHKTVRFQNYLSRTSRHGVALVDSSYYASLFLYYLWKDRGRSDLPYDLMDYLRSQDGEQIIQIQNFGQYWKDFTEKMWNDTPAQPVLVDGAPVSTASGSTLRPNFNEPGVREAVPASGTVSVDVELPALSWKHFIFEVPSSNVFASFYMGQLAKEQNFITHAYVRDAASQAWSYEDWTGKPYRRFCIQQTGVCANEQSENIDRVALILANMDDSTELDDTIAAGTLADRWRLTEVQVASDKRVPVARDLNLEMGSGGGLLVRSHGFWLVFPESDFEGESQLAYDYINSACRMKGFVKFRRDNETAEYEVDEERDKYSWETTRLEVGGLINTPSGWWCGFEDQLEGGLAGGGLAAGGSVAAIFTRLNTREYPSQSFAGRLSRVMKAVLSLQVPAGGAKEVVMYQYTTGDRTVLQVELQGNVRAFFEPDPTSAGGAGVAALERRRTAPSVAAQR